MNTDKARQERFARAPAAGRTVAAANAGSIVYGETSMFMAFYGAAAGWAASASTFNGFCSMFMGVLWWRRGAAACLTVALRIYGESSCLRVFTAARVHPYLR